MKRYLPLLIFLCLAAMLALALLTKPRHEIITLAGNMEARPLPVLKLAGHDGKNTALEVRGEVTWINFFASWCVPCVADHHELLELASRYPQLAMHGIAWNDTVSNIDDWLAQHRNPFKAVWFDTKGKAALALGVRGMPESFLIDRHGTVRYHIPGPITPALRAQVIEPLITKLMEEP